MYFFSRHFYFSFSEHYWFLTSSVSRDATPDFNKLDTRRTMLFLEWSTEFESIFSICFTSATRINVRGLIFFLIRTSFDKVNEFLHFKFSESHCTQAPFLDDFLKPLYSEFASWFLPFLVLENSLPTFCKQNVFRSISFVLLLEEIPPGKKKIVPFYPFNSERCETAILLNKEMKMVGNSVHIGS